MRAPVARTAWQALSRAPGRTASPADAAACACAAYLSGEAQSLVKALLQREAPKRLGWGEDGSAKVMAHPFFRPINWKHLLQQQVGPTCTACHVLHEPQRTGPDRTARSAAGLLRWLAACQDWSGVGWVAVCACYVFLMYGRPGLEQWLLQPVPGSLCWTVCS